MLNNFEKKQLEDTDKKYSMGLGHSNDKARFNRYFYWIKKLGKMDLNAQILDVGCGVGALELYLKNYGFKNVNAIDFSPMGVLRAKTLSPNYKYTVGNAAKNLSLIYKQQFDIIFCCQVLEHIPNDEQVLVEMYSLLKEQGLLIISTPYDKCKMNEHHCNTYTIEKWNKLGSDLLKTKPLLQERFGDGNKQLLVVIKKC